MTDETRRKVLEIDALIRQHLWFDFRVVSYDGTTLVVGGSTDLLCYHELEVKFHRVFYASGWFDRWTCDTANSVFTVPEEAEAYRLNLQQEIEQGYNLFLFRAEYHQHPVAIAAESISFSTDTVLYYYRDDLPPGVRLADFVRKPD